jgi:hemerythrin-like domain-containing protein
MTKLWADQPFKLIPTPTATETEGVGKLPPPLYILEANQWQLSKEVAGVATEMCLAHNVMVRNLNAIHLQCEQVTKPEDVTDFILFCQTSLEEIHTHHATEEDFFFPQVAEYTGEKNIMEANITQHHAFEKGLKDFEEYIYNATPETYDGKKVKEMLDRFVEILVVHLSDEIQTLLALDKYGGEKLGPIWAQFNKKILAQVKDMVRYLLPLAMDWGNSH